MCGLWFRFLFSVRNTCLCLFTQLKLIVLDFKFMIKFVQVYVHMLTGMGLKAVLFRHVVYKRK